jgi:cyclohexyl-isocyanide hydratase
MDGAQLELLPTQVGKSLDGYDIVIVPGGYGSRHLIQDHLFLQWLKTAESCKLKASVCTGSLLLGAAGFLKGKKATTHPKAFEELKRYCSEVVNQRIVDEGDVITARGVTASIDLGLYLCQRFAGREVSESIRQQMDYECFK